MQRSVVGLVYVCICISVFVTVSCFVEMGSYLAKAILTVRVPSARRIYRHGELLLYSDCGLYFVQLFK